MRDHDDCGWGFEWLSVFVEQECEMRWEPGSDELALPGLGCVVMRHKQQAPAPHEASNWPTCPGKAHRLPVPRTVARALLPLPGQKPSSPSMTAAKALQTSLVFVASHPPVQPNISTYQSKTSRTSIPLYRTTSKHRCFSDKWPNQPERSTNPPFQSLSPSHCVPTAGVEMDWGSH